MDGWRPVVRAAFERGQQLGAVGPGDVDGHIAHAWALAQVVPVEAEAGIDLGTGVGLPGLVLAAARPEVHWYLIEAAGRRAAVAAAAVSALGWDDRVEVIRARAASLTADATWRGRVDVVVSRSFGPPATTAEEARPFLRMGGTLVVR